VTARLALTLPVIVLDGLLMNYNVLDIGCGTAGYYRLAHNVRAITGVDYSQRMLDSAQELAERYGYAEKSRFIRMDFDDFEGKENYDAIRVGVYGSYEPIDSALIMRLRKMLNPDGILILGISPPRNWRDMVKDILKLSSIRMSEARFESMVRSVGNLQVMTKLCLPERIYYFLKSA